MSSIFLLFFSFFVVSCATKVPPPLPPSDNPDAATDAALGALPKKGKMEAAKYVETSKEDEAEKALRELQQREREEEERRLHRTVTDDRIVAEQG